MSGSRAYDPNSISEVFCLSAGQQLTGAASFKLADGSRIDIGRFEHVLVIFGVGGGTSAGTITMTPRESDSQTGAEFPLDGTNGAPNFTRSSPNASTVGSGQVSIRVAGRRRFLNVQVTLAATGTARVSVYVVGYGLTPPSLTRNIETSVSQISLA